MKKIIVVTGNAGKYNEIKKILDSFGISSERINLSFEECSDTVEKISVEKAQKAFAVVKKPLIVDDTGVFFEAYNNFPGHHAKRIYNAIGFKGIMKLLDGENRNALFKSAVCFTDGRMTKVFVGELRGRITTEVYPTSRKDLPYEQIFVPDGINAPMSKLSVDEKNSISHRAKAIKMFAKWFLENF